MILNHGLKTTIEELEVIIDEYKNQLKRMKIEEYKSYPIIINIKNDTGDTDEWEFDDK